MPDGEGVKERVGVVKGEGVGKEKASMKRGRSEGRRRRSRRRRGRGGERSGCRIVNIACIDARTERFAPQVQFPAIEDFNRPAIDNLIPPAPRVELAGNRQAIRLLARKQNPPASPTPPFWDQATGFFCSRTYIRPNHRQVCLHSLLRLQSRRLDKLMRAKSIRLSFGLGLDTYLF